jgi:hypothetical protein
MAAQTPFVPITASVTGRTIILAATANGVSVPGTLDSTTYYSPVLFVANTGPNVAFLRMSTEATPTATTSDTAIPGNTVRLFTNPVPQGKLGVAITVSITTSPNTVYIVPGQGGI